MGEMASFLHVQAIDSWLGSDAVQLKGTSPGPVKTRFRETCILYMPSVVAA